MKKNLEKAIKVLNYIKNCEDNNINPEIEFEDIRLSKPLSFFQSQLIQNFDEEITDEELDRMENEAFKIKEMRDR